MNDENDDENRDELLFAVKAAKHSIPKGINSHVGEILAFVEGMAPFLGRDIIINLKCHNCDNYAPSFFPVEGDFDIVDPHEYCHVKGQGLHHLSLFTIAKCVEHSQKAQKEMMDLAKRMVEGDLNPTMADKKLYDRNAFASYDLEFKIKPRIGEICIEFGHQNNGDFVDSGIKICLLKRLDPGYGEQTSSIKAVQKSGQMAMVVMAGRNIRRQMGLDEILDKVAEKYYMNIVYL